jgi:hypothetical protein
MEHRYMPARNRCIAHAVLSGCSRVTVAAEHELSPGRVAQITAAFAAQFGFNEPYTTSIYVLRERYREKLTMTVPERRKTA